MRVYVKHCRIADKEHKASRRQYAHVGHKGLRTICVSSHFYALPQKHKTGIILHELGHIFGADGEKEADKLASELFGIKVKRTNTKYGHNLETV